VRLELSRAGVDPVIGRHDTRRLAGATPKAQPGVIPLPVAPAVPTQARVFTVSSATGGCGKTFMATNMSLFLARHTGARVVLVDLDLQFGDVEGWPGVRSPKVKEFIASHQITADFWYVANPNLTVVETRRLERIGNAMEEFLDKIS